MLLQRPTRLIGRVEFLLAALAAFLAPVLIGDFQSAHAQLQSLWRSYRRLERRARNAGMDAASACRCRPAGASALAAPCAPVAPATPPVRCLTPLGHAVCPSACRFHAFSRLAPHGWAVPVAGGYFRTVGFAGGSVGPTPRVVSSWETVEPALVAHGPHLRRSKRRLRAYWASAA